MEKATLPYVMRSESVEMMAPLGTAKLHHVPFEAAMQLLNPEPSQSGR